MAKIITVIKNLGRSQIAFSSRAQPQKHTGSTYDFDKNLTRHYIPREVILLCMQK